MIKKVIYIGYMPLTEKVKQDFYFEEVNAIGLVIEYWDLSNIYFRGIYRDNYNDSKNIIVKFSSLKDVKKQLKGEDNNHVLYVINITYHYRVINLFRLLTEFNCKISCFARGALPNISFSNSKKIILKRISKVFSRPYLLINKIQNKKALYLKKFGLIKTYDFIFAAGEKGIETIGQGFLHDEKKSEIVKINYFDYDMFKQVEGTNNLINEKYCVFLDEYLPYHPDFKMFRINTIESNLYFDTLNNFFKDIEERFNISIVIAAHPKAERYKTTNPFNGRKIIFNKTAELCKYAEFAILHVSSSVSFPVLFKKSCFFISTNSIKKVMATYHQKIICYSEELGQPLINISKYSKNSIFLNKKDEDKYKNYKYKYLTSIETEAKATANIFIDFVRCL